MATNTDARSSQRKRQTGETSVEVSLTLDGTGSVTADTGALT
jgi:imidazoleglycerol phosphate dehydratase HisB